MSAFHPPVGAGPACRALLFVRQANEPPAIEARRIFESMDWPATCRPQVIDMDVDENTTRWFGIEAWPTVAVVADAMLLAVEHQCSADACERVLTAARERSARLRRRSV
jgi:hypothetical protein